MQTPYWLTNILLESSYEYEKNEIVATKTELSHLLIEDGTIGRIVSATTSLDDALPQQNGRGLLALPRFIEKHFHLDKSRYGTKWRANKPAKSFLDRLAIEAEELPMLAQIGMKERAMALLQMIQNAGSTHIRTHVNIDPYVGLKNLEAIRQALESFAGKMTWEIVAFPQHGLLRSHATELMREAMKEGATIVGGVDPAGFDGKVDRSLDLMVEMAVEANADIDLHLHDYDSIGIYTMKRLADFTEDAGWHSRVAISHAYALGNVNLETSMSMAERFAELDISLIDMVPVFSFSTILPVPMMKDKGVRMALGTNSVYDTWGPFGNADILERASRLAERYQWMDERTLAETLGFITGGIIPLNQEGKRVWPKMGDEASFVLVDASCSAEVIARRSKRQAVMHKGTVVAGTLTIDQNHS
ncbi:MAG: N-acyl-D-amino-acid deacylase family protein [Brevibacillus sp.]|nr:N-acyl-D-amino-acid deacylase family protein [Brevibacillus sp.]